MAEKDTLKAILQYLALKKVWCVRQNTAAIPFQRKDGSNGYLRAGTPGMADIQAWTEGGTTMWIEVKSEKGRQSPEQKEFQARAEKHGHIYILARSVDDVIDLYEGRNY